MHVVIDAIRMRKTSEKAKNPNLDYCYLNVSDNTGAISNVVCWPEVFDKVKAELAEDIVVCLYAKKDCWNGREQISIDDIVIIG
jgi:DNA polymerase III alpha subunit